MQTTCRGLCACGLVTASLLTGCVTQPCTGDPATDPYRCVEAALANGSYTRQLADARARRVRLEEQRRNLERTQRTLQLRLVDVQREQAQQLTRLAAMNTQLTDLNRQFLALNDMIGLETPVKEQLERRQQELVAYHGRLMSEHATLEHGILDELEAQVAQLRTRVQQTNRELELRGR